MNETSPTPPDPAPPSRALQLTLLSCAQVLVLALWFSASAAAPTLLAAGVGASWLALLTSAVQAGFVVGALASAALGLPDRFDPRRLFIACALAGAVANALILALPVESSAVLVLRFVTGVVLAGVYPVGMKLAASWARGDMGLVVGLLVGALTVGSAAPHLFSGLGGVDWQVTLAMASASAVLGALCMARFVAGPNLAPAAAFKPGAVLELWRNRGARLATAGYLGHMWELYAVWAWIAVFLSASFTHWSGVQAMGGEPAPDLARWAAFATFAMVAAGGIGSLGGGFLADRIGRTSLTIGAMAISGAACVLAGAVFGAHPALVMALCLVWGITIVADSAQFSACVAEVSDPSRVGTMLTAQTCLGFTLTLVTLQLMPWFVDTLGWRYAFAPLAIGPALGCVAMWRLRRAPEARLLAGGRG